MIETSESFRIAAKGGARIRRYSIRVIENGKVYKSSGLLSAMKIEATSSWLSTGMAKLSFSLLSVSEDLVSSILEPICELKMPDGSWESVSYGKFIVQEQRFDIDTRKTDYVAYDQMIKFYIPYNPKAHIYPCSLSDFLSQICDVCEVANGMVGSDYHNSSLNIPIDYYAKINGLTYRDILTQIAEATARTCVIGRDGKLYLKKLSGPVEILTDAEMRKLKIEPVYGSINTLNLSRQPQGDDIMFGVGSPAYVPPWANDYAGFGDNFKFNNLDFGGFGKPKSANFKGDLL